MASHYHPHHHHQSPPPSTHCCCNPSYTCCSTPPHHPSPPPPQDHHLVQAIASLLSQPYPVPTHLYPHYPKSHPHQHNLLTQNRHLQHQHQTHYSTISSLLRRIETLESFVNHHTHHHHHHQSLRHAAAGVIQTHFRSFLVRRSRTLRLLKHLALIKSTFNALKSSFSNDTHIDFPALSLKAMNLLLELDSIEGCDPIIVDGKRAISRDLVQFLDSIEGAAVKKHLRYVKAAKNVRSGQKVNKSRNSGHDDEKMKLLQNLRGRVEKISRLCKLSANDEEDSEPEEGIHHVDDDDDGGGGVLNVLINRRNEVSPNKNRVFVQRQGAQPAVKKSVRFAENGKISEFTYEPDLIGDVTCLDGSSSSDDQREVLENVSSAVDDVVVDSPRGAEDDEEALVDNGGSPHSSDDGERNSRRGLRNDVRNTVKGQLQAPKKKLLISAPLPLKMESRADLMKSKGVRILT